MAGAMSAPLLTPETLDAGGYDTVVIAAPDMAGRLFGRRTPVRSFLRAVDTGVDVCTCVLGWDVEQHPLETLSWTGLHTGWHDLQLRVDLTTLRPTARLDGVAICIADAVELADGTPVAVSPRAILKREVALLAEAGLTAQAGTELEFYLWHGTPEDNRRNGFRDLVPTTLTRADYQIQAGNRFEPFFREVRRRLHDSGIEVEAGQAEWGLGQWEMTLRYGQAVDMADRHTIYKMAVQDMAAEAGYTASFMARPRVDQAGSSCHVHLSVLDGQGQPAFWEEAAEHRMSKVMRAGLGGAIHRLPDVMLWYAPTVNSYRRLLRTDLAGHGPHWGFDNRTTSFRVLGHRPDDLRLEFRLPGADANVYLTLAALLASLRSGLAEGADPDDPVTGNAYDLDAPGVPRHLGEAAAWFRASAFARTAFGDEVVDHYAAVADHEWEQFLLAVTDWEVERYLDRL
jgi:glutamine synthetase